MAEWQAIGSLRSRVAQADKGECAGRSLAEPTLVGGDDRKAEANGEESAAAESVTTAHHVFKHRHVAEQSDGLEGSRHSRLCDGVRHHRTDVLASKYHSTVI